MGIRLSDILSLLTVVLIGACVSTTTSPTGFDRVARNRGTIEKTDERLRDASKTLAAFQDDVRDLKQDFETSESDTTRAKAADTLQKLSYRIEQSQLDIRELLQQNRAAALDLDRRLKAAALENQKIRSE